MHMHCIRNPRRKVGSISRSILLSWLTSSAVLTAQERVVVSTNFEQGADGWTAIFADYPPAQSDNLNLEAEPRTAPQELAGAGQAFFIGGTNTPDSLMMLLTRRLGPEHGIVAGQPYRVEYNIVFGSRAQSNCVGIGGAPGESVFLRAGATAVEPAVRDPMGDDSYRRLNINAGNQSTGGPAASPAGNIANGIPCEQESPGFVRVARTHVHPFAVTANEDGELWLTVLTDSGFEGRTELYFLEIQAALTPVAIHEQASLANLSTRVHVQEGEPAITGFVVQGSAPRPVLIRAVGPGLVPHGVENALEDPQLALYHAGGQLLVESGDWDDGDQVSELRADMAEAGAFPLAAGSRDAALLVLLDPGVYTAVVDAPAADEGVVLLEVYDRGPILGLSRIVNYSTRAQASSGEAALLSGLIIAPPFAQPLLLRAVGPTLEGFSIDDPVQDPRLILRAGENVIARNDQWSDGTESDRVAIEAARSGAFPLESESSDAALAVTLLPGLYTIEVIPGSDEGGVGLVEVYRRPPMD